MQAGLELDEVADPDAALEEQDDPGDEVAEDRLQAEAETDPRAPASTAKRLVGMPRKLSASITPMP
ncbi:MAG TPA: hypothetical protein VNJ70_02100 [Thermoanaerobaculia bacterium]|nr:hypothetical protein [Thermoanaerobaculia bacterium]